MLDSLVAVRSSSLGRPSHLREILELWPVDGKTSMALAGNKSLRLSQASHIKYDYLPTYLPIIRSNSYLTMILVRILHTFYDNITYFLKQTYCIPKQNAVNSYNWR